jgi:CBS domain-containing protein
MPQSVPIGDLKVKHFMTANPIAVSSNVNFPGGIAVMVIKSIGNLIVKQNQKPTGILTEREIIEYLVNEKKIPNKLLAKVVLQPFFAVYDNTRVLHAASIMIQKKGRILVFDREAQAEDNNNNNNNGSSEQHAKDYNDTASHRRRQLSQYDKDEKLVGMTLI